MFVQRIVFNKSPSAAHLLMGVSIVLACKFLKEIAVAMIELVIVSWFSAIVVFIRGWQVVSDIESGRFTP